MSHKDTIDVVVTAPFATTSSNLYTIAIQELQELESEPLCHRLAARLLVNNCHLLDGKDEATVLTDSGRAVRDFVDSYAASLAICDLERGSFMIPAECAPLREPALARLAVPKRPHLHLSAQQVGDCLHGLSQSDAAWNTWVSYRHKALRFCEAARAENEKDHNIRVYQRVTEILSKLTDRVEEELATRAEALDRIFLETNDNIGTLEPKIDQLRGKLGDLDLFMSQHLHQTAESFTDAVAGGLEEAKALQVYMMAMLKSLQNHHSEMADSHETALQMASEQIHIEAQAVTSQIAAAVASFALLHGDLELSKQWAAETSSRQARIHADMERLEHMADTLSQKYVLHEGSLDVAQKRAMEITSTLESVATSATAFQGYMSRGLGVSGLWPYVACPLVSLWMGSYGLPPSAARNIALISFGEIVGFLVTKSEGWSAANRILSTQNPSTSSNDTLDLGRPIIYNERAASLGSIPQTLREASSS